MKLIALFLLILASFVSFSQDEKLVKYKLYGSAEGSFYKNAGTSISFNSRQSIFNFGWRKEKKKYYFGFEINELSVEIKESINLTFNSVNTSISFVLGKNISKIFKGKLSIESKYNLFFSKVKYDYNLLTLYGVNNSAGTSSLYGLQNYSSSFLGVSMYLGPVFKVVEKKKLSLDIYAGQLIAISGMNRYTTDNPAIPVKFRDLTNFDFDTMTKLQAYTGLRIAYTL